MAQVQIFLVLSYTLNLDKTRQRLIIMLRLSARLDSIESCGVFWLSRFAFIYFFFFDLAATVD